MKCKRTGKVRYRSFAAALKGTQYIVKKRDWRDNQLENLNVFFCDHCRYYHIGHKHFYTSEAAYKKFCNNIDNLMRGFRKRLAAI